MPVRAPDVAVGVDGCPGGWAVVRARVAGMPGRGAPRLVAIEASFEARLDGVVDAVRSGELAAVAVDMPIGLLDTHPRPADVAARKLLGPRRSSIFPTPLRATLDATDYLDACARSRAQCGKALSIQAWNLMPKIRDVDQLIDPEDQDRIVEAHPECAFVRLHGEPLEHSKSTPEGRALRRQLLAGVYGDDEVDNLLAVRVAPEIDLIDAAVLAVTAARVATGSEVRVGGDRDSCGLRAEIVY